MTRTLIAFQRACRQALLIGVRSPMSLHPRREACPCAGPELP